MTISGRRVAILAGLLLSIVVGLSAQERKYLAGEVEGGSRLYSANCTGCHGPEGDGVGGVNFSKGQFRRTSSDDEVVRVIVRGIPGTPMRRAISPRVRPERSSRTCDR